MRRVVLGLVLLTLAGCATETTPNTTIADSPGEQPTTTGLGPRTTTSRAGGGVIMPEGFVDQGVLPTSLEELIRAALAQRTGADPSAVILVGSMSVQWPDSALGCASPGEISLQVITDGFLAYFEVDGSTYRVHTDLDSSFRICDLPGLPDISA